MSLIVQEFLESEEQQKYLSTALNFLADLCAESSRDKGFHDDDNIIKRILIDALNSNKISHGNFRWYESCAEQAEIARQVSELGEAVEGIRKPGLDSHLPQFANKDTEYADCVIRVADTCGRREIRLGNIIVAKIIYNAQRARMHGKNS